MDPALIAVITAVAASAIGGAAIELFKTTILPYLHSWDKRQEPSKVVLRYEKENGETVEISLDAADEKSISQFLKAVEGKADERPTTG